MKNLLKLIAKNLLLFFALYLSSIAVLKILTLLGASYGRTHKVAFVATLFAMIVLHVYNYQKRIREEKAI
ncbi:MAG: hypothetical protein GX921_03410 [Bacteroidales bacterium]|nr:hypothetical protein [Bacteroidales bacterium]